MTTIFVPIIELKQDGERLLVSGEVEIGGKAIASPARAITEMAGTGHVGRIVSAVTDGKLVRLAAELWDHIAIKKCIERVYRGLMLTVLPDGDLRHCALVDTPNALEKSGSAFAASASLHTGLIKLRGKAMKTENGDDNPFKRIEIGTNREADEAAIALIRLAKQGTPAMAAGHAEFFKWLQLRARAGK